MQRLEPFRSVRSKSASRRFTAYRNGWQRPGAWSGCHFRLSLWTDPAEHLGREAVCLCGPPAGSGQGCRDRGSAGAVPDIGVRRRSLAVAPVPVHQLEPGTGPAHRGHGRARLDLGDRRPAERWRHADDRRRRQQRRNGPGSRQRARSGSFGLRQRAGRRRCGRDRCELVPGAVQRGRPRAQPRCRQARSDGLRWRCRRVLPCPLARAQGRVGASAGHELRVTVPAAQRGGCPGDSGCRPHAAGHQGAAGARRRCLDP